MFRRFCLCFALASLALSNAFGATFTPVNISGFVFNDLNGNGIQGAGEPGLPGWTVFLGGTGFSAVSGANGAYLISGVGPGTFTLQEQLQPGYQQTAPALPGTFVFTTSSGVDITNENFGNQVTPVPEPASIGLLAVGLAFIARRLWARTNARN
jgi:SdrD B-like domain/PEP-CTERM motif